MASFSCLICGVDMAIARIRTADEPFSAAWTLEGANYVGFPTHAWREKVLQGQECQHCKSADRTPSDPQVLQCIKLPFWPDTEDEDDAEWLPEENEQEDDEPLEYDSESGTDVENGVMDELEVDGDTETGSNIYPLSELPDIPRPERLPHGTWHKGKIHYTGNQRYPVLDDFPGDPVPSISPEHIASLDCQSLQGINGHVLSVAQMKNCRNVRYLVPKPKNWKPDRSDRLLEEQSLFYISGESDGSNLSAGRNFVPWRSFHPSRHELHGIGCAWEFIEDGCDDSDCLRPLAVHSSCLDIYAKASLARLDRVDLDGLWFWREILTQRGSYHLEEHVPKKHPDIARARPSWESPWHHFPGSEWLSANPTEIPNLDLVLQSCRIHPIDQNCTHRPDNMVLSLPSEIMKHVLAFLDVIDIDSVAKTCRTLYIRAQPAFKDLVSKGMPSLWEIVEGSEYPKSRDWPPTWDPLCPPGLSPPAFPPDLRNEQDEAALWAEIIEECPEMEEAAKIAKELSARRRHEILAPHRAKKEAAEEEWHDFRASVETWLRRSDSRMPHHGGSNGRYENMNWRRVYWMCNPETTPLPGLRNRARIWNLCEQALACVFRARELGEIDKRRDALREKLFDPAQPGWTTDLDIHLTL